MSFQVAARATDGMVIAVGPLANHMFAPNTDFGPDYPIATIEDDDQYQVIISNPVSYLNAGKIQSTPNGA